MGEFISGGTRGVCWGRGRGNSTTGAPAGGALMGTAMHDPPGLGGRGGAGGGDPPTQRGAAPVRSTRGGREGGTPRGLHVPLDP